MGTCLFDILDLPNLLNKVTQTELPTNLHALILIRKSLLLHVVNTWLGKVALLSRARILRLTMNLHRQALLMSTILVLGCLRISDPTKRGNHLTQSRLCLCHKCLVLLWLHCVAEWLPVVGVLPRSLIHEVTLHFLQLDGMGLEYFICSLSVGLLLGCLVEIAVQVFDSLVVLVIIFHDGVLALDLRVLVSQAFCYVFDIVNEHLLKEPIIFTPLGEWKDISFIHIVVTIHIVEVEGEGL